MHLFRLSPKQRKLQLIILFALITIIGFTPWERLLSIEIRNEVVAMLFGGVLGLTGLFLLLSDLLIMVMRVDKWFSGLAMLLAPFVLFPLAFIWIISLLGPTKWQDQTVYKNGDDYLILQRMMPVKDDVTVDYRLIRTVSPHSSIRYIEEQHNLGADEDRKFGDSTLFNGKMWHKQPN